MTPLSGIHSYSPAAIPDLAGGRLLPAVDVQEVPGAEINPPVSGAPRAEADFGSVLGRLVSEVNAKQGAAGEAVAGLLNGQGVSLHQAMVSVEEASVSFQLMVEVRNKLLEAYQELMRMQL